MMEDAMKDFGSVKSAVVRREPVSGDSLRYGFCEFFSSKDAQMAAQEMQDKDVQGYTIMANVYHGSSQQEDIARSLTKSMSASGFGSSTSMDASSARHARTALMTSVDASSWLRLQNIPHALSEAQLRMIYNKHGNVLDVCITETQGRRRHGFLRFPSAAEAHRAYESAEKVDETTERTGLDVRLSSATISQVCPAFILLLQHGHPRLGEIEAELGAALFVTAAAPTGDERISPSGSVTVWSASARIGEVVSELKWLMPQKSNPDDNCAESEPSATEE